MTVHETRGLRRFARWWGITLALALLAGAGAIVAGRLREVPPPRPVTNEAFLSARAPNAPAIVWAVGDGADGSDTAKAMARRIAAGRPDRMLYLGDVYDGGSAKDFRVNYDTVYGTLAARIAPTPGNHDWPAHPDGYDAYWRAKTGAPTPPWYLFRTGGWQIISLNSEAPHDRGSPQVRWLSAQLRRTRGTCTLAFWHRPLQSAGSHGDQPDVAPLWQALRGRATLVLNGHDHNLQRLRPRDGITQLVAGAGGRSHYGLDADARLAFGDDQRDGALRLQLRPGRAELTFVAEDGTVLDRSTKACARPIAARRSVRTARRRTRAPGSQREDDRAGVVRGALPVGGLHQRVDSVAR